MNVNSVSMVDLATSLAAKATTMKAGEVSTAIGTHVLKKVMDQNEQQAQALIKMIQQAPSLDGAGKHVDLSV